MDKATVVNLLTNSGLKVFGMDSDFIYFEDPSCVFPAFDTILNYAWIVVVMLTAILLLGWAMLYIKNGVKINSLFNNAKSLILIFCVLSVVKPIVNFVYGDNLFAKQCEIKQVSIYNVQQLLDMRNKNFAESDKDFLSETFEIIDSGATYNTEYDNEDEDWQQGASLSNTSSVKSQSKSVIYILPDGTKIKRSGGTIAWRNNNPGNIIDSEFARANGAIGVSGRFAVFPDEETGLRATKKLLMSDSYKNLSVLGAIRQWAPAWDNNNPEHYARTVAELTGLSINRIINSLSDQELNKTIKAIQTIEGWKIGTEQKI